MKYIYFYIYLLFLKIIDAFKPIMTKYNYLENKTRNIIKSLSGLLQILPFINKKRFYNPVSIIETQTDCDINLNNCTKNIIVAGYIEHDPKAEIEKKYNQKL